MPSIEPLQHYCLRFVNNPKPANSSSGSQRRMLMRQASRAEVSRFAVRCAFLLPIVILVLILGTASAQTNPIVTENQQPGTAAWDFPTDFIGTDNVGQIKGYASAVSINKGESITFYVSTNPAQTFTIDVYRIGWYQGLGGRLMQHIGP